MLGKQAWRIAQSPSALWCKILKGLYFPHSDFWHVVKGSRPSWGWQSLIMGRDAISHEVMGSVRNGNQIRIKEDKWLKKGIIGGPTNWNEPQLVADLINSEEALWKDQTLNQLFDEQTVAEILTIPLQVSNEVDKLVWTGTRDGNYSVRSGYNKLRASEVKQNANQASSSYQVPKTLWNKVWNLKTFPKIRIFMWSVCQNVLPTAKNLFKRRILSEPLCPLYRCAPETIEHLLLLCP